MSINIIIAAVIAYLLGNISPSTMLARARGLDIKKEGSGNAGTTNALRVMGKKAGVITLVVDILKGVVAIFAGMLIAGPEAAYICALLVFLGHIFPVFYGFKGGKGVATGFGAVVTINPLIGLIALLVVVILTLATKKMSVGSIFGAASVPVSAFFLERAFLPYALVIAIILIVKHRGNIGRIIRGEEPNLGFLDKKK